MKIAVFSDAHGNYKAMEAFLEYCKEHSVDEIIGLGDYMTDGPYPQRMMDLLKKMQACYTCHFVRGNRENYLLENWRQDQGWKPSSPSGCLNYTARSLMDEDMIFFEEMPEEMELALDGAPVLYLCHGTPGQVRGNVTLDPEIKEQALAEISGNYLLGGHSHRQELTRHNEKMYMNPGALGMALDGIGKNVHFAVLEVKDGAWEADLVSIPYDADTYLKDFMESGLDEVGFVLNRAVKKSIVTGENYVLLCIDEVTRRTGLPPQMIPEEVWDAAAEKLGI